MSYSMWYVPPSSPRQSLGAWETGYEAAWSYLQQVNAAVDNLNRDVLSQTSAGASPNKVGQEFLFLWNDFLNGTPKDEGVPLGWRNFYRSSSSLWSRFWNSKEIVRRTGEYERRLIELYNQFKSLGGSPTSNEPFPGYEPAPDGPAPEDQIAFWLKVGALGAAAVVLAPYVVPPVIESAQKTWKRLQKK